MTFASHPPGPANRCHSICQPADRYGIIVARPMPLPGLVSTLSGRRRQRPPHLPALPCYGFAAVLPQRPICPLAPPHVPPRTASPPLPGYASSGRSTCFEWKQHVLRVEGARASSRNTRWARLIPPSATALWNDGTICSLADYPGFPMWHVQVSAQPDVLSPKGLVCARSKKRAEHSLSP